MIRLSILALLLVSGISVTGKAGDSTAGEKFSRLTSRAFVDVDGKSVAAWVDDRWGKVPWSRIEDAAKSLGKELARLAD